MPIPAVALGAVGLFILITVAVVVALWVIAAVGRQRQRKEIRYRRLLERGISPEDVARLVELCHEDGSTLIRSFAWVSDTVRFSEATQELIVYAFHTANVDLRLIRELHSRRSLVRMRAATYLAYLPTERAGRALNHALEIEPLSSVKLRLVYALVQHHHTGAVPTIIDSLRGATEEYQKRIRSLLLEMGDALHDVFPLMKDRREPEVQRIFVALAALYPTAEFQKYLEGVTAEQAGPIAEAAFEVLARHYTHSVNIDRYLKSENRYQRNLAVESLGQIASEYSIEQLLPFLAEPDTQKSAVVAMSEIIRRTPRFFTPVVRHFRDTTDRELERGLAEVLAPRAEYLVNTVLREQWDDGERLVGLVLQTRRATGVLGLLNRNRDPELERKICALIARTVQYDPWLREEYGRYARDSVVEKLGIERREPDRSRAERHGENASGLALLGIIFALVLAPAAAYCAVWFSTGGAVTLELGAGYLIAFERVFAVYAFALNSIYLLLLVIATGSVLREQQRQELRPLHLLFRSGMLPSVSIIVPAHNEERTIAESVSGLLNLRYADYEVIVVNDGSEDSTLQTVIDRFQLERADQFLPNLLNTRPVRGVYRNPRISGLLVIDKSNGGKADSLNAGINASRKEYFAAIDSDSLLEQDSLLQLAGDVLDSELPVVASGGNILPVNGCSVEGGQIEEIRVPRSVLPSFQMMEYIRAFMTGRTAWARVGTLLIISGAFGMFRKREVVDAGGYLTASGRYTKDTVAEDMELVVRVTRQLRERGEPYAIKYAAHANCWTEVPQSARVFAAQRDRWQRGLIDILLYHIRLLLNPRYGRVGMVGFPYYYIFELFGPWIEVQGYLFFLVGVVTGVLPLPLVFSVLITTAGLGALNSIVALQLAEWQRPLFRGIDRIIMVGLAVLENLGYRQYANLLRVRGYISALRRRTGWGMMRRTGFKQR